MNIGFLENILFGYVMRSEINIQISSSLPNTYLSAFMINVDHM